MSRHSSQECHAEISETLEIIREEQCSPAFSSVNMDATHATSKIVSVKVSGNDCACAREMELEKELQHEEVENMIQERELTLKKEFEQRLEHEIEALKNRFDYILENEQLRTSYMLREAHRERQEKITALQTQLECKNLAGLMYLMCAERRQSKLEKLRLIQEYTGYIRALQAILAEAQDLILNLSRGYKTAARVDHEWKDKMRDIIREFQAYVYHFNGGSAEVNQYLFDLPALLLTEAPIVDNPEEDPCETEDEENEEEFDMEETKEGKRWWELLEGDCRPFVMFGDMADFKPPQRREVLKAVKAAKTAPKKWKEYVFNEMFLKSDCSNADVIKDVFPRRYSSDMRWECTGIQTDRQPSRMSFSSRRVTAASVDVRGMNMGSILKIITTNASPPQIPRTALLAAKDSMEIASTTRLREKHKKSEMNKMEEKISIGNKKVSLYQQKADDDDDTSVIITPSEYDSNRSIKSENLVCEEEESSTSHPESSHNDSLQVMPGHKPDKDHKIHHEKVCPIDKCQRMQVDSFVRSLPPYMRANPFTHFEQTYDDYETCSPEQLEILKQRVEEKKKRETADLTAPVEPSPLEEWTPEVDGVGVQTSELDLFLPPCNCRVPSPTPVSSCNRIFDLADLIPFKQAIDQIRMEYFYNTDIQFDRFNVVGQERAGDVNEKPKEEFTKTRLYEIKKILKKHPSLCDLFQANTKC